MTGTSQRSALGALDAGRPIVNRLDPARHPEEIAADLIDLWSFIESALRSLLGGSMASGQGLIRELREREMISLDQAHAFLQFLAVRERLDRTAYQPTTADIQTARDAYAALDQGLRAPAPTASAPMATAPAEPPAVSATIPLVPTAPPLAASTAPEEPVIMPPPRPTRRKRVLWLGALLVVLAILIVGGGVYWYQGRSGIPSDVQKAIAEYQAGQHEAAWGDFSRAARQYPKLVLPHLYLARIARQQGDFSTAGNELKTALQLEPANAAALRELGAFFLARGTQFANQGRPDLAESDYDAARRNFVKSLTITPTDHDAQGWLGCTLARMGRMQEAANWISRAGEGPWSSCVAPTPPAGGSPQRP